MMSKKGFKNTGKGVGKIAKPGEVISWADLISKKDQKHVKPGTIDTAKPYDRAKQQAP